MKIKPSLSKSAPLYPTLMAMVGAVFTGCDKQTAPGVVPYQANLDKSAPAAQQKPECSNPPPTAGTTAANH